MVFGKSFVLSGNDEQSGSKDEKSEINIIIKDKEVKKIIPMHTEYKIKEKNFFFNVNSNDFSMSLTLKLILFLIIVIHNH